MSLTSDQSSCLISLCFTQRSIWVDSELGVGSTFFFTIKTTVGASNGASPLHTNRSPLLLSREAPSSSVVRACVPSSNHHAPPEPHVASTRAVRLSTAAAAWSWPPLCIRSRPMRVLLIERHPRVSSIVQSYLTRWGCEVVGFQPIMLRINA